MNYRCLGMAQHMPSLPMAPQVMASFVILHLMWVATDLVKCSFVKENESPSFWWSYGCFQKLGYPQIMNFNRVWNINLHHPFWGFSPYFWKHPYDLWNMFVNVFLMMSIESDSSWWWLVVLLFCCLVPGMVGVLNVFLWEGMFWEEKIFLQWLMSVFQHILHNKR